MSEPYDTQQASRELINYVTKGGTQYPMFEQGLVSACVAEGCNRTDDHYHTLSGEVFPASAHPKTAFIGEGE